MPSWLHAAFGLDLPLIEKVVRPMVVYAALVGLLRIFGKRELAQLNSLDLVVLLSLSNTVQNAIIGNDNSVTGGLIGAFSLLAVNYLVGWLLYRQPKLDRIFEGSPTILVDHGQVNQRGMEAEFLTHAELMTVLHRQGFENLDEVERCVLEPGGTFFVRRRGEPRDRQERAKILRTLEEIKVRLDGLAGRSGREPGNV